MNRQERARAYEGKRRAAEGSEKRPARVLPTEPCVQACKVAILGDTARHASTERERMDEGDIA